MRCCDMKFGQIANPIPIPITRWMNHPPRAGLVPRSSAPLERRQQQKGLVQLELGGEPAQRGEGQRPQVQPRRRIGHQTAKYEIFPRSGGFNREGEIRQLKLDTKLNQKCVQ